MHEVNSANISHRWKFQLPRGSFVLVLMRWSCLQGPYVWASKYITQIYSPSRTLFRRGRLQDTLLITAQSQPICQSTWIHKFPRCWAMSDIWQTQKLLWWYWYPSCIVSVEQLNAAATIQAYRLSRRTKCCPNFTCRPPALGVYTQISLLYIDVHKGLIMGKVKLWKLRKRLPRKRYKWEICEMICCENVRCDLI